MDKKLLLVEDDIFIQELYHRELQKAGFTVDACANGLDAVKMFEQNDYGLVMLDIMIPGKDGVAVLEEIKKNANTTKAATPVVMLTNMGQEDIIEKTKTLGAVGYLIKSEYDPYQVIEEIKKYIK